MNFARVNREHLTLSVIAALYFVLAILYCHFTPYGMAPDEEAHGEYVRFVSARHKLPVLSEGVTYEAHQPPLYYLLSLPFYAGAKLAGIQHPEVGARLLSIILGALGVLVCYAAVRRTAPDRPEVATSVASFVAFLPMRIAISSSVSNDILTELFFDTGILLISRSMLYGVRLKETLFLGVVIGLGLITKTTCILLLPIGLVALLYASKAPTSEKLRHVALTLLIASVLSGWWFIRNYAVYGDPLAASIFAKTFSHTARPEYWLEERGFSLGMYILLVAGWTFASFWGVFGHMNVFMPWWVYTILGVLTIAAGIGALREASTLQEKGTLIRGMIRVYITVIMLVTLAFIAFNFRYFQAQGRYLHPALLPISFFWIVGIGYLLPHSAKRFLPLFISTGMLVLSVAALITCVIPAWSGM